MISIDSIKEWGERTLLSLFLKQYNILDQVKLEVKNFEAEGLILDIGGGGEGVIGRLKGSQVIAIDLYKDELDGILPGPHKAVMDARHLALSGSSFATVTAFFSLLYMKTREDHASVLAEISRVLKPSGHLLIWDIDLTERPSTRKERFFVRLHYRVGDFKKTTGYGVKWPMEARGESYYLEIASQAGFQHLVTKRTDQALYLEFSKAD